MKVAKRTYLVISLFVAFFLAFLGMRLSFLDQAARPKPTPRAVLKQGASSHQLILHVLKKASERPVSLASPAAWLTPYIVPGTILPTHPPQRVTLCILRNPTGRSPPSS